MFSLYNKYKNKNRRYMSLPHTSSFNNGTLGCGDVHLILDKENVLDYHKPYRYRLKTTLEDIPDKGVGVVAIHMFEPDEIIAYYKIYTYDVKKYISLTDYRYAFQIYDYDGEPNEDWIGDIKYNSLEIPYKPKRYPFYIPYWGYFVNEPSLFEQVNAYVDVNVKKNYQRKKNKGIYEGRTYIYSIIASKEIKPGEEIVMYYGDGYHGRDYPIDSSLCEEIESYE
jgi:hypothetical protein